MWRSWKLWIGILALLLVLVAGAGFIWNADNNNGNSSSGGSSSTDSLAIDLSSNDDGKSIELETGQTLILTALQKTWVLDLNDYDPLMLKEIGKTDQYQLERQLRALKSGQTHLKVMLTAECAIPREGYQRCLVASQLLTVKIVTR